MGLLSEKAYPYRYGLSVLFYLGSSSTNELIHNFIK